MLEQKDTDRATLKQVPIVSLEDVSTTVFQRNARYGDRYTPRTHGTVPAENHAEEMVIVINGRSGWMPTMPWWHRPEDTTQEDR